MLVSGTIVTADSRAHCHACICDDREALGDLTVLVTVIEVSFRLCMFDPFGCIHMPCLWVARNMQDMYRGSWGEVGNDTANHMGPHGRLQWITRVDNEPHAYAHPDPDPAPYK